MLLIWTLSLLLGAVVGKKKIFLSCWKRLTAQYVEERLQQLNSSHYEDEE